MAEPPKTAVNPLFRRKNHGLIVVFGRVACCFAYPVGLLASRSVCEGCSASGLPLRRQRFHFGLNTMT